MLLFLRINNTYPKQKDFLANKQCTRNQEILIRNVFAGPSIGCFESCKFALERLDADKRKFCGDYVLFISSLVQHPYFVDGLLAMGFDPNKQFNGTGRFSVYNGKTPLHAACQNGDIEIVKKLLDDDRTEVNLVNPYDGNNALMYASAEGHSEIVDLLLRRKVDLNTKN